jgi:hypothetical protein
VDRDIHLIFVLNLKHNQNVYKDLENWEVCQGGIITVEIKNSAISVIGKEWILKMVLNVVVTKAKLKSLHKTVLASESRAEYKLDDFICELATSYWASTITDC